MKFSTIFLLFFIFQDGFADQPRLRYSFKSANGFYELKPSDTIFSDKKVYKDSLHNSNTEEYTINEYTYSDRYIWSLYDLKKNKKLYTLNNSEELLINSKTALISDDGKNIIIVDDFSGGYGFKDFEVVHFYKKNKLIKHLALKDLLLNMCSFTYSTSHMNWCFSFGISIRNTFEIKTYDFYNSEYNFDGELIKRFSDKRINNAEDIIYAKIKRLYKNKYRFKILISIRDKNITNKVLFIDIEDKIMREIFGTFYGFLPNRNKKMESEFYRAMLFKDNKPLLSKIDFPNYNSSKICNLIDLR